MDTRRMTTPLALDQPGPTFARCRELLQRGGSLLLDADPVATDVLRAEYRDLLAAAQGGPEPVPTVGFEDAVERLGIAPQNSLRVGYVTHPEEPWLFVVFVDPDSESALSCFGVNHRDATPEAPVPAGQ